MPQIEIPVSDTALAENSHLAPGEQFNYGLYTNAAGNTAEFHPNQTDECPLCYATLEKFAVTMTGAESPRSIRQPLLSLCPECDHIPFKHEAVHLVSAKGSVQS